MLAACTEYQAALNQVYNVAVGQRATLNELYELIRAQVTPHIAKAIQEKPLYRDFRAGDVRHSLADISKAQTLLGYQPSHTLREGLEIAADWYLGHQGTEDRGQRTVM